MLLLQDCWWFIDYWLLKCLLSKYFPDWTTFVPLPFFWYPLSQTTYFISYIALYFLLLLYLGLVFMYFYIINLCFGFFRLCYLCYAHINSHTKTRSLLLMRCMDVSYFKRFYSANKCAQEKSMLSKSLGNKTVTDPV